MKAWFRRAFALARETFAESRRDHATLLAAGVAFFSVFSLAPLTLLLLGGASLVFGSVDGAARMVEVVQGLAGADAAAASQRLMAAASRASGASTALSVVLLLVSASTVFRHLKGALNIVLDVPDRESRGIVAWIWTRLLAALMAICGIVLVFGSVLATALLSWLRTNAPEVVASSSWLWRVAEVLVAFVILTLFFGAVLRYVPDIRVRWLHVTVGSMLAAALFVCCQLLIGVWAARAEMTEMYGAAGFLILLLVYVFVTTLILLFAAELAEVLARRDEEFRKERREAQDSARVAPRKE